jgi:predicted DNA-binding protein
MEVISLKVPHELARWLEERSRASGRPKSEIVRDAVEQLREHEGQGTALEAAGDAVGRVASGCADLGSNKKRLHGFGR